MSFIKDSKMQNIKDSEMEKSLTVARHSIAINDEGEQDRILASMYLEWLSLQDSYRIIDSINEVA